MPEGHTIHRLARDIGRDLRGEVVRAESRQARFTEGAELLDGRTLEGTAANGKNLFLRFDGAVVLHVHLGLVGKFRRSVAPFPGPSPALRVRLRSDEAAWDLTGAITCDVREPDVMDEVAAALGPDPLRRDGREDDFVERVRRSRKAIGALLLDQSVIAGIGNVYRAEILHLVGIHPDRPGISLSDDEARRIWKVTVEQLRLGLKRDRIVTVPLAGRRLSSLSREEAVHVYKQERCRSCDDEVLWHDVGGRTMYTCLSCQSR